MIKVTDQNSVSHYLHPDAIARVSETGASSAWHGIHALILTFDGQTIEAREYPSEILKQIAKASHDTR